MAREYPEIGQRLNSWGMDRFGTAKRLAEELGISQSQMSAYINGIRVPGNVMQARLRELGCDIEWLMTGNKAKKSDVDRDHVPLMQIPVYASVTAGGKTGIMHDAPIDYVAVTKSRDATLFGVKVRGRSMEPLIYDGDIVICSLHQEPKSGDLCLVNWEDGEYSLRYVHFNDRMATLSSANAVNYPPVSVPASKINRILRVVRFIREL